MTITINCFGLGSNVTNYLQDHVGSKYNLVSNDFPMIFNSESMGAREYLHTICTEMSSKYCSQVIVGINAIELDCLTGYPGAFVNTIKNRGKLKEFSKTFKGEAGILKFSIMFYTSKMDHYYFKNTVRGTVCKSENDDIFSKFNSTRIHDKNHITNEPLKQLVHFMRNQNIVPIRSPIKVNSNMNKKSNAYESTPSQPKGNIPIIRSRGNTPVIRSRGRTPVIQSSENVPLVPTRKNTPDKVYAYNTKDVIRKKVKYTTPYFPSIAKV